jgi:GntR family transcriptional regulator, transcriptional repressor for pyruvate dehydrogenase complex
MSYQIPEFTSVKMGRVSQLIVRQIKSAIVNGPMKPGDKLPSERELGDKFEASRNSVREALKMLEVSGLVTIRRGYGVFVSEINSKAMSEPFSSMVKMKNMSLSELTEARLAIEPGAARLACERITDEDFRKLEENIQKAERKLRTQLTDPENNINFHVLMAEATHNPSLILMMNMLFDVVKEMRLETAVRELDSFHGAGDILKYHKKILKCLREKNAQKVHDLMFNHILEAQRALKTWMGGNPN